MASGTGQLTSLERIALALQYKKPDRVPVVPLFCGASHRVLGIGLDVWSKDAVLATKSLLAAQELIGYDAFVTLVDLSVEAYDFGQDVIFSKEKAAYSNTDNPLIKTVDDYYKVSRIDPTTTPRMSGVIEMCRGLAEARGKEVAVIGFVYGPLGVLSQMRGHDTLFKETIKQPDAVLHAVDVITDVLVDYAKAQIRAGAHAICYDPLYSSSSVLSKATWEKFEGPFSKRICDAIRGEGGIVTAHNCGTGVYFDSLMEYVSPVAISHAYPAYGCGSWEEHVETWGKKVVTIGYSEPVNTALHMTRDEIMEDCRRQIETFKSTGGGFILATGCEFPSHGNLLSAVAMVQAAKTYGVYD